MKISKKTAQWFQKTLFTWNSRNVREMPWKGIKDPYLVWLSEIILQQTRVDQGWEYFLKFKKAFPTVTDLANAKEQQVLKLWQGLGYYSRARNLHFTAKYIHNAGGMFQADYQWLLSLKGVGPYTAAAISSFAFDLPYAVVDGNVYRVLSRIFAIETAIDSTEGKRLFQRVADQLLDQASPAQYNQAIIDFGATYCKPKKPVCHSCPFTENCKATAEERTHIFPVKQKSIKKRKRYFNYLDIRFKGKRLFRERIAKDVWKGLFDFPLVETASSLELDQLKLTEEWKTYDKSFGFLSVQKFPRSFKQQLTHQSLQGDFFVIEASFTPKELDNGLVWKNKISAESLPFPKMISFYLADKGLYLNL